ncbi:MAG: hypothetical protein IJ741_07055 [Schwartzia sp.]|nr:hypothetical protein [Schwartzia sp. (in: firmicutes)]
MAELKQSRWVKVHEPGHANYEAKENIMDILIGENRCRADVTYTVRSHKKAADWMLKYLEAANAGQILHEIAARIEAEAENKEDLDLNHEKWSCQIEKMDQGIFKVQLIWAPGEPVTKKQPAKQLKKKAEKKVVQKVGFNVPKRYLNRVREAYEDSDGFWIELKNGWMNGENTVIHEDSAKEAVKVLKDCTKVKKA